MKSNDIQMNQNELVHYLKKPSKDFTREDIIRFIEAKTISMVNFRYVADDGKLKSLNFVPFIIMMENLLRVPRNISCERHIPALKKIPVIISSPFAKFEELRVEAVELCAKAGSGIPSSGSSSGGSYKYLLGRQEQICSYTGSAGMEWEYGYD